MTDFLAVLEDKIKAAQAKFDELQSEEKKLTEQRSELDRKIGLLREEQVRLQGDYRAFDELKKDYVPEVSSEKVN